MTPPETTSAAAAENADLSGSGPAPEPRGAPPRLREPTASRARQAWDALRAALGVIAGLVPHVLHHIGIFAGAAFLAGFWGSSLLYVVGLALSIPMLRRLRRHFGTWIAPAIGVAVFSGLFALSALVIGPAISGWTGQPPATTQTPTSQPVSPDEHASHHQ